MTEYTVIFEQGTRNWSACVPDLPGWVAAAETRDATAVLMAEAIRLHVELMRDDGDPIPPPRTHAGLVAVA